MNYKIGDKIDFVLGGFLTKGEIIEVKRGLFKRYRVSYRSINIVNFRTPVIWIKPKDIIGADNGKEYEANTRQMR